MEIIKRGWIGVFSLLILTGVSLAAQPSPASLVATEGEVKQFFARYVERYNQRDLTGFLSLFSSKAVQNREDGSEKIRKTYSDFFNQSKDLRYQMQDMKIEIYQNAVEAGARYQLDQVLKENGKERVFKGRARWSLVREGGGLKILSLDYTQEESR